MLFVEMNFVAFFLPFTLAAYFFFRDHEIRLYSLLLSSFIFYATWNARLAWLMPAAVALSYPICVAIDRMPQGERRRVLLVLGIVVNLAPLAYFKYGHFLTRMFTASANIPAADAFLPLGISFYTFQQITFLVDVYRGRGKPGSFRDYLFVIMFFPHFIAGPILRPIEFMPQIAGAPERAHRRFAGGLAYFLIGFAKKIVIADPVGDIADGLYGAAGSLDFQHALLATLAYTFQIYFDFSGYSDMAIGLGRMFGFELPINFDSPYKATSIIEFWRRWHITLSSFLRDYIYVPLGGNRSGEPRRYANIMLTMLIGGLWHGAAWTFVVWGGLHGLLIVLNHGLRRLTSRKPPAAISWAATFVCVALLWVLFRAGTFEQAGRVYGGLLHPATFTPVRDWFWIALAAALCPMPNSHAIIARLEPRLPVFSDPAAFRTGVLTFGAGAATAMLAFVAVVAGFYGSTIDQAVYRTVHGNPTIDGIDNRSGDLRSNLFSNAHLYGPEKKVIFAGSSFTRQLGRYEFVVDGRRYRSGTLGIGGNGLLTGARTAILVGQVPDVDIVVLGISPLNFGTSLSSTPFADECVAPFTQIDPQIVESPWSSCGPVYVDGRLLLQLMVSEPRRHQIRNFAYKVLTESFRQASVGDRLDLTRIAADLDAIRAQLASTAQISAPLNRRNGLDARFKWADRGIMESLDPGNRGYQMIKLVKDELAKNRVPLVVYETPTASSAEHPTIYPPGFLDAYRARIRKAMRDLGIPYIDLMNLVPFRPGYMQDFIHPEPQMRRIVHRLVLYSLYVPGFDLKSVCPTCEVLR